MVDEGAAEALAKGKSLLPAGVKRIEGAFMRGDTVSIITLKGREIARGLVTYDAADAGRDHRPQIKRDRKGSGLPGPR